MTKKTVTLSELFKLNTLIEKYPALRYCFKDEFLFNHNLLSTTIKEETQEMKDNKPAILIDTITALSNGYCEQPPKEDRISGVFFKCHAGKNFVSISIEIPEGWRLKDASETFDTSGVVKYRYLQQPLGYNGVQRDTYWSGNLEFSDLPDYILKKSIIIVKDKLSQKEEILKQIEVLKKQAEELEG